MPSATISRPHATPLGAACGSTFAVAQVAGCMFVGMLVFRLLDFHVIHPEKAVAWQVEHDAQEAAAAAAAAPGLARQAEFAARAEEHRKRCGLDQPAEYIMEHCQTDASREADRAVMRNQLLEDAYSRR
jgi:hypothetical protein